MHKPELVEAIAAASGITATDSERFLNNFIKIIYSATAKDQIVNIQGFGQFSRSHRKARLGVNPRQPSIKITIKELYTPKFRAGEGFKKAVSINK